MQSSVKKTVLEKELSAFLKIHGVKVEAATVIKALADSGFLSISGAELVAPDGILIGAGEGALFSFGRMGHESFRALKANSSEVKRYENRSHED